VKVDAKNRPCAVMLVTQIVWLDISFVCDKYNKSRAIAERTARCRCNFRYVSNFTATSCGFSATARLSCIHQRPFKWWNCTQYADFHGRDAKSRHTTKIKSHGDHEYVIILYSANKCYNNATNFGLELLDRTRKCLFISNKHV